MVHSINSRRYVGDTEASRFGADLSGYMVSCSVSSLGPALSHHLMMSMCQFQIHSTIRCVPSMKISGYITWFITDPTPWQIAILCKFLAYQCVYLLQSSRIPTCYHLGVAFPDSCRIAQWVCELTQRTLLSDALWLDASPPFLGHNEVLIMCDKARSPYYLYSHTG